jgi:hypothetical protein
MSEDDWAGWKALTDAVGAKCQLVGDDLFVTKPSPAKASRRHRHSILIKINQIGTLLAFAAIEMAKRAGYRCDSHRSVRLKIRLSRILLWQPTRCKSRLAHCRSIAWQVQPTAA